MVEHGTHQLSVFFLSSMISRSSWPPFFLFLLFFPTVSISCLDIFFIQDNKLIGSDYYDYLIKLTHISQSCQLQLREEGADQRIWSWSDYVDGRWNHMQPISALVFWDHVFQCQFHHSINALPGVLLRNMQEMECEKPVWKWKLRVLGCKGLFRTGSKALAVSFTFQRQVFDSTRDVSQVSQPHPKSTARQVQGSDLFFTNIIIHKEGMFGDPDLAPFEDSFRTSSGMVQTMVQTFIWVITKRDLWNPGAPRRLFGLKLPNQSGALLRMSVYKCIKKQKCLWGLPTFFLTVVTVGLPPPSSKSTGTFDGNSVVLSTQDVATSSKSFQVCGSSPQWKPSLCSSVPWASARAEKIAYWRMVVSFLFANVGVYNG